MGSAASKNGFHRAEMNSQDIRGKLKPYTAHFFIGTGPGTAETWPSKISSDGGLGELWSSVRDKLPNLEGRDTITAYDGPAGSVVVFPACVQYTLDPKQWTKEAVAAVLTRHLQSRDPSSPPPPQTQALPPAQPIAQDLAYLMVCSHVRRDARCGECGPVLIDAFKSRTGSHKDSKIKFAIHKCSHIGGHAFAGNVLFFGPTPSPNQSLQQQTEDSKAPSPPPTLSSRGGDWYGYVTPEHVDPLLHAFSAGHLAVLSGAQWRGSIGLDEGANRTVADQQRQCLKDSKQDKTACTVCSSKLEW